MNEPIHIISLGAGVQSSTMALMAAKGELPAPRFAVFADTGDEPAKVYRWLDHLTKLLPFAVHVTQFSRLSEDLFKWGHSQIPAYFRNDKGEVVPGKRQCTKHWKVVPVQREIRKQTGTTGKRLEEHSVHLWKGISTDEASRAKDDREKWIKATFPLLDKRMSRHDCKQWMARAGLPEAPKSACFFCPYRSDDQWQESKNDGGQEWDIIVALDRKLNERGEYLHQSMTPIDEVIFNENHRGQLNLFTNECEGMCGV